MQNDTLPAPFPSDRQQPETSVLIIPLNNQRPTSYMPLPWIIIHIKRVAMAANPLLFDNKNHQSITCEIMTAESSQSLNYTKGPESSFVGLKITARSFKYQPQQTRLPSEMVKSINTGESLTDLLTKHEVPATQRIEPMFETKLNWQHCCTLLCCVGALLKSR